MTTTTDPNTGTTIVRYQHPTYGACEAVHDEYVGGFAVYEIATGQDEYLGGGDTLIEALRDADAPDEVIAATHDLHRATR